MAYLNKVQIIGNLGRDPELRYVANGDGVVNFSVAVNRRYKTRDGDQRESTEWVRVVAWRRLSELAAQYLQKGSQVFVEGRLQTRKWEDKAGQSRETTEVLAQDIQFLAGGHTAHGDGPVGTAPAAVDGGSDDLPFE